MDFMDETVNTVSKQIPVSEELKCLIIFMESD